MDLWGWFYCVLGALVGSILLWRGLGKSAPLSFKLLASYCLFSMISVVLAPEVKYPEARVILATFSAQAFIVFVCGIAIFKWGHKLNLKFIVSCLVCAELLRLVFMWDVESGFLRASTFSSSFLAATIMFVPIYLIPFSGAAILILGGMTAKTILAVQLLAYLWIYRYYLSAFVLTLGYVCLGANFAYIFLSAPNDYPKLAGMASRLEHWKMLWNFWVDNIYTVIFGTGFGTLEYLGFLIQRAMYFQWHTPKVFGANLSSTAAGEMFQRMHNDWYQVLFELGVIGLFLTTVVYWKILKRALKTDKAIAISWIGIGVWGLTYYPLHSPFTVIFVALIAQKAWKTNA